jgi:hypothetical protein
MFNPSEDRAAITTYSKNDDQRKHHSNFSTGIGERSTYSESHIVLAKSCKSKIISEIASIESIGISKTSHWEYISQWQQILYVWQHQYWYI